MVPEEKEAREIYELLCAGRSCPMVADELGCDSGSSTICARDGLSVGALCISLIGPGSRATPRPTASSNTAQHSAPSRPTSYTSCRCGGPTCSCLCRRPLPPPKGYPQRPGGSGNRFAVGGVLERDGGKAPAVGTAPRLPTAQALHFG
jgi:hypothetical protein